MLNKNAQLWVDALRSDEYEQTYGRLEVRDGYCCLDVACRVYQEQTGIKLKTDDGDLEGGNLGGGYDQVREWLGLKSPSGRYIGDSLTSNNDEDKYTFADIANIIESDPDGLFV